MNDINEKFFELSEQKQQLIINAALEVFALNDYRHAITDDIAAKAGISKGLLFYYFRNKQALYLYLYQYCEKMTRKCVDLAKIQNITDFFELLNYGASCKVYLLSKNPYLFEFVMKMYYANIEVINDQIQNQLDQSFQMYFGHIDFSKFKEGIDPKQLFTMLVWMTDGFMNEQRRSKHPLDVDKIMEAFQQWSHFFKQIAYKEEYL